MEDGEHPRETVVREAREELSYDVNMDELRLVGLSVIDIEPNPERACQRHWDIWYAFEVPDEQEFMLDTNEFHEGSWLLIEDAWRKIEARDNYAAIIRRIGEHI